MRRRQGDRAGGPAAGAPWSEAGEIGVALLLYALLAGVYLRPIWRLFRDHLTPDPGDPLLNLYFLEWGMRQLRLGMPDFWNANFFWPLRDAMTLSEHLLGPAVEALGLTALLGSPVAAYNVLLFTSFALSGAATFFVFRRTGLGAAAAFAGGLVFTFSPYRWSQLSHLQVLLAQWIPLTLWFWDRLLAESRARSALGFAAFYALHVTGGTYLAYLIHLPLLVLAANRAGGWRRWISPRGLRVLVPTGLACAALLAAVFLPYAFPAHGLHLDRGADNFRVFGATSLALLTPSLWSRHFHWVDEVLQRLGPGYDIGGWWAEKTLFPGLVPAALAIVGLIVAWRRYRSPPARPLPRRRRVALASLAAAAVALFAAADLYTLGWWPPGPREGWFRPDLVYSSAGLLLAAAGGAWLGLRRRWGGNFPLRFAAMPPWPRGLLLAGAVSLLFCFPAFFTAASKLLPGLGSMRVPCRLYPFASLAVALLAAAGFDRLAGRLPRRGGRAAAAAAAGALALLAVTVAPVALPWNRVPTPAELPPVYAWIAHRDDVRVLAELPFRDGVGEAVYMHASTAHWKPIVNGFSGFAPPWYQALRATCCRPLPEREGLTALRALGVTHLVVHYGEIVGPRRRQRAGAWRRRAEAGEIPGLREAYRDDTGVAVYALSPK